jgi:hypothetical protein
MLAERPGLFDLLSVYLRPPVPQTTGVHCFAAGEYLIGAGPWLAAPKWL